MHPLKVMRRFYGCSSYRDDPICPLFRYLQEERINATPFVKNENKNRKHLLFSEMVYTVRRIYLLSITKLTGIGYASCSS